MDDFVTPPRHRRSEKKKALSSLSAPSQSQPSSVPMVSQYAGSWTPADSSDLSLGGFDDSNLGLRSSSSSLKGVADVVAPEVEVTPPLPQSPQVPPNDAPPSAAALSPSTSAPDPVPQSPAAASTPGRPPGSDKKKRIRKKGAPAADGRREEETEAVFGGECAEARVAALPTTKSEGSKVVVEVEPLLPASTAAPSASDVAETAPASSSSSSTSSTSSSSSSSSSSSPSSSSSTTTAIAAAALSSSIASSSTSSPPPEVPRVHKKGYSRPPGTGPAPVFDSSLRQGGLPPSRVSSFARVVNKNTGPTTFKPPPDKFATAGGASYRDSALMCFIKNTSKAKSGREQDLKDAKDKEVAEAAGEIGGVEAPSEEDRRAGDGAGTEAAFGPGMGKQKEKKALPPSPYKKYIWPVLIVIWMLGSPLLHQPAFKLYKAAIDVRRWASEQWRWDPAGHISAKEWQKFDDSNHYSPLPKTQGYTEDGGVWGGGNGNTKPKSKRQVEDESAFSSSPEPSSPSSSSSSTSSSTSSSSSSSSSSSTIATPAISEKEVGSAVTNTATTTTQKEGRAQVTSPSPRIAAGAIIRRFSSGVKAVPRRLGHAFRRVWYALKGLLRIGGKDSKGKKTEEPRESAAKLADDTKGADKGVGTRVQAVAAGSSDKVESGLSPCLNLGAPSSSSLLRSLTPSQQSLLVRLHSSLSPVTTPTSCFSSSSSSHLVSWAANTPSLSAPWSLDDVHLLSSYLYVMNWPEDLQTSFPRNCVASSSLVDGGGSVGAPPCSARDALLHTLHFRQTYRPAAVTPLLKKQNAEGWIYARGTSLLDDMPIVWMRAGKSNWRESGPDLFVRSVVHAIDRASAKAFRDEESRSAVGVERNADRRYLVVLDCEGFGLSMIPTIAATKRAVGILGDHFPKRLGGVLMVNLSNSALIFLSLVKTLLAEKVRNKLVIGGKGSAATALLSEHVDLRHVPKWLGGEEDWTFDAEEYFGATDWTDLEANQALASLDAHR